MDLFCDAHEMMRRYGRHVGEMERLLVFHGVRCGEPESFGAVGAKLGESRAFRTDVSALARGVRDAEGGAMSAEEMLTVMALAVGGEDLVEGRTAAVGVRNAVGVLWVLLDAVGGWRETEGAERSAAAAGGGPGAERDGGEQSRGAGAGFVGAAEAPRAQVPARGAEPTGGAVAESGDRVELAIRELRVYLDDIDRRICRLEPHVEGLSQTLQASAKRLERFREEQVEEMEAPEEVRPEQVYAAAELSHGNGVPVWRGNGRSQAEPEVIGGDAGLRGPEAVEVGHFSRGMAESARERAASAAVPEVRLDEAVSGDGYPEEDVPVPARRSWVAETMGMTKVLRDGQGAIDWKRRIGVWSGAVAVVFAVIGLYEMTRMSGPGPGSAPVAGGSVDGTPRVEAGPSAPGRGGEAEAPVLPPVKAAPAQSPGVVNPVTDGERAAAAGMGAPAEVGNVAKAEARHEERAATQPEPVKGGVVERVAGKRVEAPRTESRVEEPRRTAAKAAVVAATPAVPVTAAPVEVAEASRDGGAAGKDAGSAGGRPVVEVRSAGAKVLTARRPVYPAEALRTHTEATVVLNAFLAKDGTVRRMDVVKGAYGFNRSAMDAVWGWKYQPLVVHGQPVETETQITVDYRLH